MTKLAVQIDRMCVVELATALDLAGHSFPYPHGFRFTDGRVVWEDAIKTRGKRIRIQRRDPTGVVREFRYVRADAMFEVVGDFDDLVFTEPPA